MEFEGHAERFTKTVTVKKKNPRASWTNRTTKLVEKYCNTHKQMCKFSQHGQLCRLTRQQEYAKNKKKHSPTKVSLSCRRCEQTKDASLFYPNPVNKTGRATICNPCKKKYDKARNDTWEVLIRACYRSSIRAHGNKLEENPITLEKCKELLELQKYKCAHCLCPLTCKQGTVVNCSYTRASLDRIDTTITGYGNGNAQWLCVSCNKGKCTMPDKIHKEKFSKLRDRIDYLERVLKENTAKRNPGGATAKQLEKIEKPEQHEQFWNDINAGFFGWELTESHPFYKTFLLWKEMKTEEEL